ncbi:MAG: SufD family Fe-S cluster assembly protein, partial [Ignisphaera sp.]|nr:SufD family Fe-S cluster assembly protein [Ignisphaera sp.]
GLGDSHIDVGENAEILGEDAGAELIVRALARDESRIIMRSRIVGKGNSRGHIECGGLMLSDKAYVQTIPELIALDPNVSLTHEAFIGRLAEDEINYLVSKGFTRDEAVSALVRGFASVEIENIPEKVKNYIKSVEKVLAGKAL